MTTRTSTTTWKRTIFFFFFFAYSEKNRHPGKLHCTSIDLKMFKCRIFCSCDFCGCHCGCCLKEKGGLYWRALDFETRKSTSMRFS